MLKEKASDWASGQPLKCASTYQVTLAPLSATSGSVVAVLVEPTSCEAAPSIET